VSKKKFSSGLDSIFEVKEEAPVVATAPPPVFASDNFSVAQPTVMRRAASKNFTSDLDSLFQDAFTEAVEEKLDKLKKTSGFNDPFESAKRETRQALSGLDALIRSTVDVSLATLEHAAVKRLTIIFENKKIEKLKSIAKMEKAFVKDIVSEVLTEFINDYERRTGKTIV
jgi:hypothetical protein